MKRHILAVLLALGVACAAAQTPGERLDDLEFAIRFAASPGKALVYALHDAEPQAGRDPPSVALAGNARVLEPQRFVLWEVDPGTHSMSLEPSGEGSPLALALGAQEVVFVKVTAFGASPRLERVGWEDAVPRIMRFRLAGVMRAPSPPEAAPAPHGGFFSLVRHVPGDIVLMVFVLGDDIVPVRVRDDGKIVRADELEESAVVLATRGADGRPQPLAGAGEAALAPARTDRNGTIQVPAGTELGKSVFPAQISDGGRIAVLDLSVEGPISSVTQDAEGRLVRAEDVAETGVEFRVAADAGDPARSGRLARLGVSAREEELELDGHSLGTVQALGAEGSFVELAPGPHKLLRLAVRRGALTLGTVQRDQIGCYDFVLEPGQVGKVHHGPSGIRFEGVASWAACPPPWP
jgi:hypothetical protein